VANFRSRIGMAFALFEMKLVSNYFVTLLIVRSLVIIQYNLYAVV